MYLIKDMSVMGSHEVNRRTANGPGGITGNYNYNNNIILINNKIIY